MPRKKRYTKETIVASGMKKVDAVARVREYRDSDGILQKIVVMFGNKNMVIKPAEMIILKDIIQSMEIELVPLYDDIATRIKESVLPIIRARTSIAYLNDWRMEAAKECRKITNLPIAQALKTVDFLVEHGYNEWFYRVWVPFSENLKRRAISLQ